MSLIPEVVHQELTKSNVIIERHYGGSSFELIKYNTYSQSEYFIYIDDLFMKSKKELTKVLPEDEIERLEYIESLSSEFDALSSFFVRRKGWKSHINNTKEFFNAESYESIQLRGNEYNDEIEVFVSYQYLLIKKSINYLKILKSKITNNLISIKGNENRIIWKGKAAQLGYIIHELIDKGYIEPPKRSGGEINQTELGRLCLNAFQFKQKDASVIKMLNFKSNALDGYNKLQFSIPHESKLFIPDMNSIS